MVPQCWGVSFGTNKDKRVYTDSTISRRDDVVGSDEDHVVVLLWEPVSYALACRCLHI